MRAAASASWPVVVETSTGVTVTAVALRSTAYTSVEEDAPVATSTVTALPVSPMTDMANVPPPEAPAQAVVTLLSGAGVGRRTANLADQPVGLAASAQEA